METFNYNYQQTQTYHILGRAADQLVDDGGMAIMGVGAAMVDLVQQNLQSVHSAPPIGHTGHNIDPRLLCPLRHPSAHCGGILPQMWSRGQRATEQALRLLRLPPSTERLLLRPLGRPLAPDSNN